MMEHKWCSTCGKETWQNSLGGKNSGFRCTLCANPVGTGFKVEKHKAAQTLLKKAVK